LAQAFWLKSVCLKVRTLRGLPIRDASIAMPFQIGWWPCPRLRCVFLAAIIFAQVAFLPLIDRATTTKTPQVARWQPTRHFVANSDTEEARWQRTDSSRDWHGKLLVHTSLAAKNVVGFEQLIASFGLSQDLDSAMLIIWIDEAWDDLKSHAGVLAKKYKHIDWVEFAFIDRDALVAGTCWEGRREWTKGGNDEFLTFRFWSDLLRVVLLWKHGGFWVDADTILLFDFQPYARRHHDNFMVACDPINMTIQGLIGFYCVNEIMMAQSQMVRDQMLEFSCMSSYDFDTKVMTRPTRPSKPLGNRVLTHEERLEKRKIMYANREDLQDLWNTGILLLCLHAQRAGEPEGDRCNHVWYPVKYGDPTYRPDHGPYLPPGKSPVGQFCESAYYSPEYWLGDQLERFQSQTVEKFLESDEVPLVMHTHSKYCRTHRAQPAGSFGVFTRLLEKKVGRDFGYVTSVDRRPQNWAFVKLGKDTEATATERREFHSVVTLVLSPPGHSQSRSRWRRMAANPIELENPFEKESRNSKVIFVVPYAPGTFPAKDERLRMNGKYPPERLESEADMFEDTLLVPSEPPAASAVEEVMIAKPMTKADVVTELSKLRPWILEAFRQLVTTSEVRYVMLVLDDRMMLSQVGLWSLFDDYLFNSGNDFGFDSFFDDVQKPGVSAGLVGAGCILLSRDVIQELSNKYPEARVPMAMGRPESYWGVSTSFGDLQVSSATFKTPAHPNGISMQIVASRGTGQNHKNKSHMPELPRRLIASVETCTGKSEELVLWRNVLAVAPMKYQRDEKARTHVQQDATALELGTLTFLLSSSLEAVAMGTGTSGPCLMVRAATNS